MRAPTHAVLGAAVAFSVLMGALTSGGWWWAWFAGIGLLVFGRGIRLPLLGVRLDPATRFILRENRKTRRHTRHLARQRRRRLRDQKRAQRPRTRQAQ
jgi:hypothetical protein